MEERREGGILKRILISLGLVAILLGAFWFWECRESRPPREQTFANALPIPSVRQTTEYSCGAAAMASVFAYYGKEWSEHDLMVKLETSPRWGTHLPQMQAFAQGQGIRAEIRKHLSIADLRQWVEKKQAVIVAIQAWAEGVVDYASSWEWGHYVVVVGVSDDKIYFMDPASLSGKGYLSLREFESRWHDVTGKERDLIQAGLFFEGKPLLKGDWEKIP
jgi:uncharacterized protein